jgi:hypothetical protein
LKDACFAKTLTYKETFLGSCIMFYQALVLLLTNILTAVENKLKTYCATTFVRDDVHVNNMWILKNFKELIKNLQDS